MIADLRRLTRDLLYSVHWDCEVHILLTCWLSLISPGDGKQLIVMHSTLLLYHLLIDVDFASILPLKCCRQRWNVSPEWNLANQFLTRSLIRPSPYRLHIFPAVALFKFPKRHTTNMQFFTIHLGVRKQQFDETCTTRNSWTLIYLVKAKTRLSRWLHRFYLAASEVIYDST